MLLSDRDIIAAQTSGEINIDPFDPINVKPASYDLHLGPKLLLMEGEGAIDVRRDHRGDTVLARIPAEGYMLMPGQFVLGSSVERIAFSAFIAGRLDGKSSLGRLGLSIHITAGFMDPGFAGHTTLEMKNETHRPLIIYADMPIAQMSFFRLLSEAATPYGRDARSKYYDQGSDPRPSEYFRNFEVAP